MPRQSRSIRVGCCGFAMAQEAYFRAFNCVEINSSFYQLPRRETAARWRASAPESFAFALKAWQVITHPASCPTYRRTRLDPDDRDHCGSFRANATVRWAWDETFAIAQTLQAILVLFQCPASFRPNRENLANFRRFFETAKRGKFHLGWEPRGDDWTPELIAALCRELDLIHVGDPLQSPAVVNNQLQYFRLHGLAGSRSRYAPADLLRLKDLCRGRLPVYCLFNTVAMAPDAQRFLQVLDAP